MRRFTDEEGRIWVATAHEEDTPRHHGRWFLVFHAEADETRVYPMPEVRWQTPQTADRTVRTMSVFELRKRLRVALTRAQPDRTRGKQSAVG